MDDDTINIQTAPRGSISGLVLQGVQIRCGYIITNFIVVTVDSDCCLYSTMWLNQHLAVLGHVFLSTCSKGITFIIGIFIIL